MVVIVLILVKGYNAGYSSTCGKNPDGCNNILTAISPDPFYASGWADGHKAAIHDLTNSSVTTRPNQTMQNCPRTYCHGYWAGYRVGWSDELDIDANGPCFPRMQQLILAKCISGVRMDSNDYKFGWVQAIYDYFNQFPVPTYPKSYAVPVKAINHERTVCALGSRDAPGEQINSTNACYAGYYDHMLPRCYLSHTCNKYNPIKPIGYPPSSIPLMPPPSIENSTRLVYDNYYGAGYVQGKQNAIVDRHLYTTPDDTCLAFLWLYALVRNYMFLPICQQGQKHAVF